MSIITLNVGGHIVQTLFETVAKMASPERLDLLVVNEGVVFVDRDWKYVEPFLHYARTGIWAAHEHLHLASLVAEAQWWGTASILQEYLSLSRPDLSRQQLILALVSHPSPRLYGLNLSNLSLTNLNFSHCDMERSNLSKSNMANTKLEKSRLQGAACIETNFEGARIHQSIATSADFTQADLSRSFISMCNFTEAVFASANLSGVTAENTDFSGAQLSGANLSAASFEMCDLSSAILSSETRFSFLKCHETTWEKVNFSGRDLSKAVMTNCNLHQADLSLCNLEEVNFTASNCRQANFQEANCFYGDFTGCIFQDADLRNTNFMHANFTNADLSGAQIAGASFDSANFLGCVGVELTIGQARFQNSLNLDARADEMIQARVFERLELDDEIEVEE